MPSILDINETIPLSDRPSVLDTNTSVTYKKNMVLCHVVGNLSLKDRRTILSGLGSPHLSIHSDTLFPKYGLTAGEFSTWLLLTDKTKSKKNL